jgi:hypothetical protein
MIKMLFAVLLLGFAASATSRYVHGSGSATEMDQSRAHAEALQQAKENLENACSNGHILSPQVTTDDCHAAGPGSFTCRVEITATCSTE